MTKDTSNIPHGPYCYSFTGELEEIFHKEAGWIKHPKTIKCPYWEWRPEQMGYCSYLEEEDYLLWDQVKCCGVNDDL